MKTQKDDPHHAKRLESYRLALDPAAARGIDLVMSLASNRIDLLNAEPKERLSLLGHVGSIVCESAARLSNDSSDLAISAAFWATTSHLQLQAQKYFDANLSASSLELILSGVKTFSEKITFWTEDTRAASIDGCSFLRSRFAQIQSVELWQLPSSQLETALRTRVAEALPASHCAIALSVALEARDWAPSSIMTFHARRWDGKRLHRQWQTTRARADFPLWKVGQATLALAGIGTTRALQIRIEELAQRMAPEKWVGRELFSSSASEIAEIGARALASGGAKSQVASSACSALIQSLGAKGPRSRRRAALIMAASPALLGAAVAGETIAMPLASALIGLLLVPSPSNSLSTSMPVASLQEREEAQMRQTHFSGVVGALRGAGPLAPKLSQAIMEIRELGLPPASPIQPSDGSQKEAAALADALRISQRIRDNAGAAPASSLAPCFPDSERMGSRKCAGALAWAALERQFPEWATSSLLPLAKACAGSEHEKFAALCLGIIADKASALHIEDSHRAAREAALLLPPAPPYTQPTATPDTRWGTPAEIAQREGRIALRAFNELDAAFPAEWRLGEPALGKALLKDADSGRAKIQRQEILDAIPALRPPENALPPRSRPRL